MTAVAEKLVAVAFEFDTVVHPDENMDNQKSFGQNAPDLRSIFDAFPEAGFCLDVAHVWTNDPTLLSRTT
jgi:hypothetical protein